MRERERKWRKKSVEDKLGKRNFIFDVVSQSLLTHVSRSTKHTLNRLGVFTVSSFHAYICARSPSLLNNLLAGRGATRRRAVAPILSRSNSLSSRKSQSVAASSQSGASQHAGDEKQFRVNLPDGQTATVHLKDNMTVEEFLASACGKRGLNPAEHFVRVKKRRDMDNSNHFVPHRTDLIDSYVPSHELVEICGKALYQVELSRNNLEQMWGFSVEAELVENTERQDELCVFVSRVEDRSVAMNHGIRATSTAAWTALSLTGIFFSSSSSFTPHSPVWRRNHQGGRDHGNQRSPGRRPGHDVYRVGAPGGALPLLDDPQLSCRSARRDLPTKDNRRPHRQPRLPAATFRSAHHRRRPI